MPSFEGFKRQLLEAEPGERLSYHIGNLTRDRGSQPNAHKIAILVSGLYITGRAVLSAQRLDRNSTAYFVTLRTVPAHRLSPMDLTRAWTLGQENFVPPETKKVKTPCK